MAGEVTYAVETDCGTADEPCEYFASWGGALGPELPPAVPPGGGDDHGDDGVGGGGRALLRIAIPAVSSSLPSLPLQLRLLHTTLALV